MKETLELGGMFAAHAVWCVSEGETLIPILATLDADGQKDMARLEGEDLGQVVATGKQVLEANDAGAVAGALLYDVRIALETGEVDAIVIEMRPYRIPGAKALIAVPYAPSDPDADRGFRVHRPKVLEWDGLDPDDLEEAMEAFWSGIESHEHGARIWNESIDESL